MSAANCSKSSEGAMRPTDSIQVITDRIAAKNAELAQVKSELQAMMKEAELGIYAECLLEVAFNEVRALKQTVAELKMQIADLKKRNRPTQTKPRVSSKAFLEAARLKYESKECSKIFVEAFAHLASPGCTTTIDELMKSVTIACDNVSDE
jgi:hypothetical protein